MNELTLVIGCTEYDHTRALFDGSVQIDGVDAVFDSAPIGATDWYMPPYHFVAQYPQDWWPYGIRANGDALDTYLRYFFEQGLSSRQMQRADLFVPTLLAT